MSTFDRMVEIYDFIKPVLDIGILTFILYKAYGIAVKTHGLQIIKFLVMIFTIYAISLFLNLTTILQLLNLLGPGLIISFAIVFQPELRKIVLRLLQTDWFKFGNRSKHSYIDSVLVAADTLSKQRRGMLAVFTRKTSLSAIIDTGTRLSADLSSNILVTIFGHDTPLHDGAVIIQSDKVIAAGCFLPLSEQYGIKKSFGTRHRAAIGLTEETDAVVLIVSEETGAISLAYESHLYYDLTETQLIKTLETVLEISNTAATTTKEVSL